MVACAPAIATLTPETGLPGAFEAQAMVRGDPATLDQWWRLFADTQLEALIEEALSNSTDARLALARLEEARALRAAALSRYRLQGDLVVNAAAQRVELIDGAGVAGRNTVIGDSQSATGTFNLSWEVDLFGRIPASRTAADQDFAAARFFYEASRAALAADVAEALFVARGLAMQLEDAERALAIQTELYDVLRIRAERGLSAGSEAARAEADVLRSEAEIVRLQAELQAAKRVLLVLIGRGGGVTADLLITPTSADAPFPPALVPGDLLTRRPDVREAEARFLAATARTDLQRLELFPRLTLEPGVGLTTATEAADYTLATWTLGANLLLPILDRPRLLAELDAQTARADQAALTYERAVQTAFSEADQALVRLEAAQSRLALVTQAEAPAAEAYAAARERFARGLGDLTTTLEAERSWRSLRVELSVARTDALQHAVTAFRALGGGWPPTETHRAAT